MTEKTQEILDKYCSKCSGRLTIGKKGGLYCKRCTKPKKEKK